MNTKRIVAVSGGFDPVHIGHVRLLKEARTLGDELVVILNNDHWLRTKKGFAFMSEAERMEIISGFSFVDRVVLTEHQPADPDRSVCASLEKLRPHVFANGGDRFAEDIPEFVLCKKLGIDLAFNVGTGGKVQSSSNVVAKADGAYTTTSKPWGMVRTHATFDSSQLMTLHLNPGSRTSLQRHSKRSEIWMLLSGDAQAAVGESPADLQTRELTKNEPFLVSVDEFYRLSSREGCVIAEVRSGVFDENDIEEFQDDYGRSD